MSLDGKVAVVTGGSRGIGRAIALRLAGMGAQVAINYVSNPGAAQETVDMIVAQGGKGSVFQFDVSDSDAVNEAMAKIIEEYGSISILVNNAGITRDGLLMKMKEERLQQQFTTITLLKVHSIYSLKLCITALEQKIFQADWEIYYFRI